MASSVAHSFTDYSLNVLSHHVSLVAMSGPSDLKNIFINPILKVRPESPPFLMVSPGDTGTEGEGTMGGVGGEET